MQYGKIDGVGKDVSRIGQGLMMLGEDDLEGGFTLLDAVYAAGTRLFDSAHLYGGGQCDRVFGQWVRDRGVRAEVVLMDKCSHHTRDRTRVTPYDITSELHDCLARLGFDYIDIFAFHRDDESAPVGPLVDRLNQHVAEGKIRAFGASNWSHQRIAEANAYAETNGLSGFVVSSPQYSLAECIEDPWGGTSTTITGDGEQPQAARQWYQNSQMALVPWSALCGGFFSERFRRDNLDGFTDRADERCVRCYCGEDNFRRLDRAAELAKEKDATVPQLVLAYMLCGPMNCYPLTAAYDARQAADNAAAAEIDLTEPEVAWLDLRQDSR